MRAARFPIAVATALLLVLYADALAQNQLRGSISGTVSDETGGALPGVTLTVTSPVLQVPQLVRVTDASGTYQLGDLGPGTYKIMFELPGFATVVHENFVLQTAFSARVDVSMKVATMAETVTVSGASFRPTRRARGATSTRTRVPSCSSSSRGTARCAGGGRSRGCKCRFG